MADWKPTARRLEPSYACKASANGSEGPASRFGTGNALGDRLLTELAQRSEPMVPRHWVHYLHLRHEADARETAAAVKACRRGPFRESTSQLTAVRAGAIVERHRDAMSPEVRRRLRRLGRQL